MVLGVPNGGNECNIATPAPGVCPQIQLKAMMEEEKASQRTDEEILEENAPRLWRRSVTQDTAEGK